MKKVGFGGGAVGVEEVELKDEGATGVVGSASSVTLICL